MNSAWRRLVKTRIRTLKPQSTLNGRMIQYVTKQLSILLFNWLFNQLNVLQFQNEKKHSLRLSYLTLLVKNVFYWKLGTSNLEMIVYLSSLVLWRS